MFQALNALKTYLYSQEFSKKSSKKGFFSLYGHLNDWSTVILASNKKQYLI